jgi:hypothetical protein
VRACLPLCLLAGALLYGPGAFAQTLTFGPILGRGHTPDQTIIRWGTTGMTDATTIAYRKKGDAMWQLQNGAAARDHEVVLSGLAAGTTYEYEVRSLATASGASFSTCPPPGRPMDFVFYGDSRSGFGTLAGEHAKVVMQVMTKLPEMVFESGDIVPDGTYGKYLSEFAPAVQELAKTVPFMAAPGNHDAESDLASNYGLIFPSPRPDGAAWKSYYAFPCGNALFIGLDSNSVSDATQLQFLNDQLKAGQNDATIDHVFVWLHHAPYSVGTHGDNTTVQSTWVPIFNKPEYKVTAVFAGHDHLYERLDDGSGVLYIVSGGAGANLYSEQNTSQAKKIVAKATYNFVSVHLSGPAMTAVAYDDTGTEIDRFSSTKGQMLPDGGQPADLGSSDSGGGPPSASSGCTAASFHGSGGALGMGTLLLLALSLSLGRRRQRAQSASPG